jgi:cell division protein FtsL
MGGRIPEQIKREVLKKWLLGERRNKIATDLDVGDGIVSEIIKLYSEKDSEVDLISQVALAIKALQTDVSTFSQALRLKNILNSLGLKEEKIESLINVVEVHCFKRNLKLEEFFEIVEEVASYSNKVGIPLEDLSDHISEQKRILDDLYSEIEDAQNDLSVVLRDNDLTQKELEDYKKDKTIIDRLEETRLELVKVTKDREG